MTKLSNAMFSLLCCALVGLAGCASKPPAAYADLSSASQLRPNLQQDAERTPYVYAPSVSWGDYSSVLVEPVAVYRGLDHQFADLPEADKQELARYMAAEFSQVLGQRFKRTTSPGPQTLRLKLTLTGAQTNTAVVSTFTRFDLVGLPYNAVQGVRGKEGIFMGSATYAVEIHDAQNQRLLKAFVTRQYPNAMNIAATFGALHAAKTGIDKGAQELLAALR